MNVYLVRFYGHYLGGEMFIIALTQRKAFNKAKNKLNSMGLGNCNNSFSMNDLELVDCNKEQIILIDDGDY